VLELDEDALVALPMDQLGLLILEDLAWGSEMHERNYIAAARKRFTSQHADRAIATAFAWLRARVLIAQDPRPTGDSNHFIITTAGQRVLEQGGLNVVHATELLQEGLHPLIETKARRQFLLGEYEQAVFVSMKAVEVRVRQLCSFGDECTGVALMNLAFGTQGPLTDSTAVVGEQDGTRFLFAGAYAVFRNPSGHRDVDYDDVREAAEMIQTASLLMRILDRVEVRRSS
jgi:uncharacterized protein (TIGR02391 family)